MRLCVLTLCLFSAVCVSGLASAQQATEAPAVTNWVAPLYYQPSSLERSTPDLVPSRAAAGLALNLLKGSNNGRSVGRAFSPESLEFVAPSPLPFVAITPCRQYNSLNSSPLLQGTNRAVDLTGTPCFIPATALAVSANITVFNISGATGNGVFKVGTLSPPTTAWINYPLTETQRSNAGTLSLNGLGQIIVQVAQGAGQVDFVVDVNGYYADLGSPRAFAYVDESGPTLIRSKNFTALSHPSAGSYCLTPAAGIAVRGTAQLVTIDWGTSSGSDLLAFANDAAPNCSGGDVEVRTYQFLSGLVLSNNVSFYLVLP